MRYLSVCSGIEAASVAWQPLGWEAVAFSEIEPFPCAVLAHHYPAVPNWGDLTKFKDWPDANVDLLVGGTPCQSFSVAGLRQGLDDPRGSLLLTYLAVARRYRPRWLVWENVPGVLSSDDGRAFGSLLGGLAELGYGFAYRILDAQYFGLAQRRQRVFVVGHLGNWRRAAAVLFERESLSGHPAPRREAGQGTTYSAAPSLTGSGRGTSHAGESRGQDCVIASGHCIHGVHWSGECRACGIWRVYPNQIPKTVGALNDGAHIPIDMRQASRGATMTNNRAAGSSGGAPGTGIGEDGDPSPTIASSHVPAIAFDTTQMTSAANRSNPKAGDPCHPLAAGAHAPAVAFNWQSGGDSRGLDPKDTAQLQRCQTPAVAFSELPSRLKGAHKDTHMGEMRVSTPASVMQVRRLTPRECERLQGFSDDYTLIHYRGKPAADGPRYKALGNSMAVPCMAWIGRRIALVESIDADLKASA